MHADDVSDLAAEDAAENNEHENEDSMPGLSMLQHWQKKLTSESWAPALVLLVFLVLRRLLSGPIMMLLVVGTIHLVHKSGMYHSFCARIGVSTGTKEHADLDESTNDCAADSDDGKDDANEAGDNFEVTDNTEEYSLIDSDVQDATGCTQDSGMDQDDPTAKARLDLLLRCMSAMETREGGQEPKPQQRKLQRKLLQRAAASIVSKNDAPAADVADSEKPPEQDSEELEELIKELDDPKQRRGSAGKGSSRGQPKRAAAGKRKGVVGVSSRQSAKQVPKQLADTDAKEEPSQSSQDEAEDASSHSKAPTKAPDTSNLLEAEAEEAVPEPADFQVVSKRRARRSGPPKSHTVEQSPESAPLPLDPMSDSPGHPPIVFGSLLPEDFEIDPEDVIQPDSPLNESPPLVPAPDKIPDTAPIGSDESGDWEWQCPDGHQLEPYIVPAGKERMQCSSCRQQQRPGASVLRSSVSGWLACEECIHLAYDLPVETQESYQEPPPKKNGGHDKANSCNKSSRCDNTESTELELDPKSNAANIELDPYRMSALQIAKWFKLQGAEEALRQCMQKVLAEKQGREAVDEQ